MSKTHRTLFLFRDEMTGPRIDILPRKTLFSASFTFSAKEKDQETGFSYFGSRYYSSDLSIWLSVDPMSDKYPSLSPYVYCADNPVKLVDPNGEDIITIHSDGSYSIKEKKRSRRVGVNGIF